MLLSPLVLLLVLVIGMMIGSIGIGGVLQVPVLHFLGGVPIHAVIPACMLAYLLPGIVGGLVYHRHGSLHGPSARQVCLGAVPGALLGAWLLPHAPGLILETLIALLILFSGVDALVRRGRGPGDGDGLGATGYVAAGFFTGTICALTGAGGPLVLVPVLVWFRVPVRVVVGLGQVIQIPISLMATGWNLHKGIVDLELGLWLTAVLSVGVLAGGWAAHRLAESKLKMAVALLLTLVGAMMLIRLAVF